MVEPIVVCGREFGPEVWEHRNERQSGVALRFPPHSKTSPAHERPRPLWSAPAEPPLWTELLALDRLAERARKRPKSPERMMMGDGRAVVGMVILYQNPDRSCG
jgi:hypothetical protein